MIEAKFYLTETQLTKTKATLVKFRHFLQMDKPTSLGKKSARRWNSFFGELGYVKSDNATKPTAAVFLGFHSSYSERLITDAKSEGYMIISPNGAYYKVLESASKY